MLYSEEYKDDLEEAAILLDAAALKLPHYPKFGMYLTARARAFRDNSFLASEEAWMQAFDAPFECVIGPVESYSDTVCGRKTFFEGWLGVAPEKENREIDRFKDHVMRFDEYLGGRYGYESRGHTPIMKIVDEIAIGGEARTYIGMAQNLPNDGGIKEKYGSKKNFFRNTIEAKMRLLTKPIGERVIDPKMHRYLATEVMLPWIIGHELAHGLTFYFGGDHFREAALSLEESKADVLGSLFIYYLEDVGEIGSK